MKKLVACVVVYSLSALLAVAEGGVKALPDIEGSWTATSLNSDGKKSDLFEKNKVVWTFKEGMYTVTVPSGKVPGTYKLEAKQNTANLDMTDTEGVSKGKVTVALLKREGDILTVAIASGYSKDRPKDFAGGAGIDVVVLKRNKYASVAHGRPGVLSCSHQYVESQIERRHNLFPNLDYRVYA
jgi:uncharacterized protein (TIGR03067 family)